MHFPIIALEEVAKPKEDWVVKLPEDDDILCRHTDYYGEKYNSFERRNVIKSDWLKVLFGGIAYVDDKHECITFYDRKSIENTLAIYYNNIADHLKILASQKDQFMHYELTVAANKFRRFDVLFFKDYGTTTASFMDDAIFYPNQTLYIGNIFDAHI